MARLVAVLSCLLVLDSAHVATGAIVLSLRPEAVPEETIFGYALAAAGGDVVVGAPHTTVEGHPQAGAVHVFEGGTGVLRLSLRDPGQGNDDLFGHALAASPRRILVGAPRTRVNGLAMAGAAYLFDAGSGELLRRFTEPTPTANAEFGSAVALVETDALIAAPAATEEGVPASGCVYRFDANGAVRQVLVARPARPYEVFGTAFAPAGTELLVGAPQATIEGHAHAGAAYLLDAASGTLRRRYVNPAPADEALFGSAVASTATMVAVGAPNAPDGSVTRSGAVYLYDRASGDLMRTLREPVGDRNDRWFGYALASACGHLLVSALHANVDGKWLAGAVYEIDPTSGSVVRTLREPTANERGGFGVAVAALGQRLLVGAERGGDGQRGMVYAFDCATSDAPAGSVSPTTPDTPTKSVSPTRSDTP